MDPNDAILKPYPRPPARKADVALLDEISQPPMVKPYVHMGPDTRDSAVSPPPNGTPSTWPSSSKDTHGR